MTQPFGALAIICASMSFLVMVVVFYDGLHPDENKMEVIAEAAVFALLSIAFSLISQRLTKRGPV